jgi:hypothetical protein
VKKKGGGARTLYLDARIPFKLLKDNKIQDRFAVWIEQSSTLLGINSRIKESLEGVVFEVRQGYKSKDSKRQNADIANAATAYTKAYLPCVAILSSQIDDDVALRYTEEKWLLLKGVDDPSTTRSIYAFMKVVVGFDLAAFFQRNRVSLRKEVHTVLSSLLSPN